MYLFIFLKKAIDWLADNEKREIESYLADSANIFELEEKIRHLERRDSRSF